MRYPFSIMWYEGMPLDPAVFQQSDLHKAEILDYLLKSIYPNSFGVTKLNIDETKLSEGIFAIEELECIMPDHSIIAIEKDSDKKLSIDLKERAQDFKLEAMYIFLTIPNNHLAYESSIAKPRYSLKEIEGVKDITNKDSESTIHFLEPLVSLTIGSQTPIGMLSLPVAKIHFTGINYEITNYIAPTLTINTSNKLTDKLTAILTSGRDKLKYLLNKNEDTAENKLKITNLGNLIFPIEKILKTKMHPEALFDHLINNLGSAISLLHDNFNVPTIPKYNHLNILGSIFPLLELVNDCLESIKEPYQLAHFTQKDGIFGIKLPVAANNAEKITIGLHKNAKTSTDDLATWLTNAIITSEDKLTTMQDQRIQGANRTIIKHSERLDIKKTNEMLLAEISLDKSYITPGKLICILNLDLANAPEMINLFFENPEE